MSLSAANDDASMQGMRSRLQTNAVASSLASLLTKSLLHPIDTIKSRIQVYLSNTRAHRSPHAPGMCATSSSAAMRHAERPAYPVWHTWRAVRRQYESKWGLTYLYSGLSVRLLFYVPYQTLYMTAYNTTHDALRMRHQNEVFRRQQQQQQLQYDMQGKNAPHATHPMQTVTSARESTHVSTAPVDSRAPVTHTMIAVLVAECASCVIRVPMEAMKTRIQVNLVDGMRAAIQQLRRHGMYSLARLALCQTAMHDIPYSMVQWMTYESLRPWMQRQSRRGAWTTASPVDSTVSSDAASMRRTQTASSSASSLSSRRTEEEEKGCEKNEERMVHFMHRYRSELVRTFFSGGFSGLMAAVLTAPLDNIRTRVLVRSACEPAVTVRHVLRDVYMEEGMIGFMRGSSMRVLWTTTSMALYFPLYELLRLVGRELSMEA